LTTPPSSFPRDQAPSAFATILRTLCERTRAECAALVDDEGETVDYWGLAEPFVIRLFAAEFAIVLRSALHKVALGAIEEVFVRGRQRSVLVRALPDGYALVLHLPRRCASTSRRAVLAAVRALSLEAGFDGPLSCRGRSPFGAWRSVGVEEAPPHSRRPNTIRFGDTALGLDVIGRVAVEGADKDRGYRVRLENGQEGTLVREPLGRWYLDEDS
jgi:hypothetical protein